MSWKKIAEGATPYANFPIMSACDHCNKNTLKMLYTAEFDIVNPPLAIGTGWCNDCSKTTTIIFDKEYQGWYTKKLIQELKRWNDYDRAVE